MITRRSFLINTAITGTAITLAPLSSAFASGVSNSVNKLFYKEETKMKTRKLGNLEVSELGLGCMNMAGNYNPPADHQQSIKTIRTAFENGVRFFDTAEVYGPYTDETLVGEALQPVRDQVKIATKFGFAIDGTIALDSRPERIKKVVEESLKRCGQTILIYIISTGLILMYLLKMSQVPSKILFSKEKYCTLACQRQALKRFVAPTQCSPSVLCSRSIQCGHAMLS